jgi:hypothetical protein
LATSLLPSHLEPAPFGAIPLHKLRPSDIDALVLAMRAKMKPAKIEDAEPLRALSDSTIRQTYTVLRAALDGAVRDGLIARNPTALVTRPGVQRHEARHIWTPAVSRRPYRPHRRRATTPRWCSSQQPGCVRASA